ncbi:glycosyltransferase [Brevundimonas sp.]|uniref:glycosyltransferase n=1 Tax=Brevundimonas sp. TaxID=1871086 RepID=UPI002D637430|nr:glycosyltransferase [Brevundimonas sp.]HYC69245.1 glycosyltransferase [Brevundimonas sp.]
MDVWILKAHEPLPLNGGRRFRAGQMSRAFAERGARVTWWNSTFSHLEKARLYDRQTEVAVTPAETAICLHGPAYRRNLSVARAVNHRIEANAFRREAARRPRPDLIVAALPTLDLAEAASEYAARHGVPFVVDVRDQWPDVFTWALPKRLQPAGPLIFAPLYAQLRRILRRADAITAVGDGVLGWAQGQAGREQVHDRMFRTACDRPVIDAQARRAASDFWRSRGLGSGDRILALAASLNTRSCGPMLDVIRAFRAGRPDGWKLVICGSGSLEAAMRNVAGDDPAILMTGWLDQARIRSLYDIGSAGLIPYPRTADFMGECPNKVGEYLGSGLPILTSLAGETGQVIEEGRAGWIYESPADLMRLLARLAPSELRPAATPRGACSNAIFQRP